MRIGDYLLPTLVNGADVMGSAVELWKARAWRVEVPTRERVLVALRAGLAAESRHVTLPRDQPLGASP